MIFNKIYKNTLLVLAACLILTACATKKEVKTTTAGSEIQNDIYTGTETVEYLADGVPDRVFFATNETVLTTASRETLRAQAAWLRKNSNINVVVEGHADERGTREYNLALGERRANAAKDYLMTYGISSDRISVLSYGKERPVDAGSNPLSWSKNRRSVTVKAN
ncbi:peptidoglycan-associated lipoprotein Pal [Candidatus Pelagibacter bacterium]|jgi:peptidoglycan-associated lipoprotein|nr:peptidoglycan-associated lipoprotein Pal [Candidatus Pelagibacter bacterium]